MLADFDAAGPTFMNPADYTLPLDQLPDPLPIVPLEKPFDVTIRPPGSKSITNRAYVLAALAEGESRIIRPLRSEDTDALLDALCTLGAEARWVAGEDGDDVLIKGVAGRFPRGGSVNLGDGGTPTRFMIAAACLAAEPVVVDGSPRMHERPIAEGVEMLRKLGATIEYVEEEGRLPVRIVPSEDFKGGELSIGKTASSQFISALMLIGPWMRGGIRVNFRERPTSVSYLHLTVGCIADWDADYRNMLEEDELAVLVPEQRIESMELIIEPDASSAAYWIVAAAITESRARIPHLPFHSQQPDVYVARRLQPAVWKWDSGHQWASDVRWPVENATLRPLETDARLYPDGAMALCVALSRADGPSTITGLHTLRVKETDRIAALANELRKIGCTVETTDDSITITPLEAARDDRREERAGDTTGEPPQTASSSLRSSDAASGASSSPAQITIETYNDHRMAMSFAILGLVRPGIAIANPKCVAKSYPTFWRDFAKLYESSASR
ncbi:MAG: 3-phosphoshikimate 1-carboxyvinyltransferase [Phycisphaerales bacterium]|nr:MAG: 3-phosphoshikimate 1-carboxyvinyltransferase [Phycisphaerales bacterium]